MHSVYIDGEQVTDLMNGEHVVFYLSPGVHRIGVSTQFDPVVEMHFMVTADTALYEPRVGHLQRRSSHRFAPGCPIAPRTAWQRRIAPGNAKPDPPPRTGFNNWIHDVHA